MIKIDPEFQAICPVPLREELEGLEQSLLKEGCRDPLVVWANTLLDGHNRYNICQKHNIPFERTEVELADRDAAIQWIINNAFARRNLTPVQKIDLAERLRGLLEEQAAKRKQDGLRQNGSKTVTQEFVDRGDKEVNAQIGKIAGVR